MLNLSQTENEEGFRVRATIAKKLANSKRRIDRRLDKENHNGGEEPMFTAHNLQYELSGRTRGIAHGGIGARPRDRDGRDAGRRSRGPR